jgi:hypothetical protein
MASVADMAILMVVISPFYCTISGDEGEMSKDAAAYPFDLEARLFAAVIPCWLGQVELSACGHALGLATGRAAPRGMDVLREACVVYQPEVTPELLDRGDWREALDRTWRATFTAASGAVPGDLFLGDYGWGLPPAQVELLAATVDQRGAELFEAVREELRLVDLIAERIAGGPADGATLADWEEPGAPSPRDELPEAQAARATAVARSISERMNALAAGLDPGLVPPALQLLERRAKDEISRMMQRLQEAMSPLQDAGDLARLLRPLRTVLVEAQRGGLGLYLALA